MKRLEIYNPIVSDDKTIIFFGELFITIREDVLYNVKVYRDSETKPLHLTFGDMDEIVMFIEIISEYRQ